MSNMERKDTEPQNSQEARDALREILNEGNVDLFKMVRDGEASFEKTLNEKGNLKSYKIIRKDGTLLYYKDLEELRRLKLLDLGKLQGEN